MASKLIALCLATLTLLTTLVRPAHAQPRDNNEGEGTGESTSYSYSCDGLDCFGNADDGPEEKWTEADFVEVGLKWDRQYSLYAIPNDLKKLQGGGTFFTAAYGWGTNEGDGIALFRLTLGSYKAKGLLDGHEVDNSQSAFGTPETVGLGFHLGQYLAQRLILTEGLTAVMSENGPGAQLDFAASVVVCSWFAFEAGINAGFYRTGVENTDGDQVNMLGLGPSFHFVFTPWGDYRAPEKPPETGFRNFNYLQRM